MDLRSESEKSCGPHWTPLQQVLSRVGALESLVFHRRPRATRQHQQQKHCWEGRYLPSFLSFFSLPTSPPTDTEGGLGWSRKRRRKKKYGGNPPWRRCGEELGVDGRHPHARTHASRGATGTKKKHSVSERREGAELDGTLEPGPGVLRATIGGGLEPMMPRGRPLVHSSYSAHS